MRKKSKPVKIRNFRTIARLLFILQLRWHTEFEQTLSADLRPFENWFQFLTLFFDRNRHSFS